ncbi:MAG: hypothetical protein KKF44_05715 [Nanoarchaeota archaeon]|nr:hypothetical protein [Nanoarchaeota archaeon]
MANINFQLFEKKELTQLVSKLRKDLKQEEAAIEISQNKIFESLNIFQKMILRLDEFEQDPERMIAAIEEILEELSQEKMEVLNDDIHLRHLVKSINKNVSTVHNIIRTIEKESHGKETDKA